MCGIFGYADTRKIINHVPLRSALDSITHRGPDQDGFFINRGNNLFLGHKRLSIHDLSESGIQPMHSHNGQATIIFNGEIYNYKEIKSELESQFNIIWRGTSDTEVLLEAISRLGIELVLPKLNGMFAFAYYCYGTEQVFLARDRFGEKPLYYYMDNCKLAFSSELRPLEMVLEGLTINESAVSSLIENSYIPSPISIYKEVKKLKSAHYLKFKINEKLIMSQEFCYWNYSEAVSQAKKNKYLSLSESLADIEEKLEQSVRLRMDTDVPFGAFLSGGIDSTCIVALMQKISSKPVDTFSIGFYEKEYNEALHAREVANALGTSHNELYLSPKDVINKIPNLPFAYDEPFADSSQLPTLIVSEFAKKNVTVALTGDSGDELFAGYNRHLLALNLDKIISSIPLGLRKSSAGLITSISPSSLDSIIGLLRPVLGKRVDRIGDKLHKLSRVLCTNDHFELYRGLISTSNSPGIMRSSAEPVNTIDSNIFESTEFSLSEKIMLQDTLAYMQHDILTKVDRAAMYSSLEARVPFLDNHVFDAAWRSPIEYKLYNQKTKYPLRHIISKYLPDKLMARPKAGFGMPISHWLRGELREWSGDLLSEANLKKAGLFNEKVVVKIWEEHQSGKKNHQYELWNILMFMQWLEMRI